MKRLIYLMIVLAMLGLLATGCAPDSGVGAIVPPYIDTGIDPDSWATVPAGEFPYGQQDHMTVIDYDYEIMVTDVTNQQYADFLNEALAAGEIGVGEVEVEFGESVAIVEGVFGYYPGDPFHGYEHEFEIKAGDKLYIPLHEEGLRMTFDSQTFTAIPEYANHPVTMVSWFGADAYAEFYGWRIPTDIE